MATTMQGFQLMVKYTWAKSFSAGGWYTTREGAERAKQNFIDGGGQAYVNDHTQPLTPIVPLPPQPPGPPVRPLPPATPYPGSPGTVVTRPVPVPPENDFPVYPLPPVTDLAPIGPVRPTPYPTEPYRPAPPKDQWVRPGPTKPTQPVQPTLPPCGCEPPPPKPPICGYWLVIVIPCGCDGRQGTPVECGLNIIMIDRNRLYYRVDSGPMLCGTYDEGRQAVTVVCKGVTVEVTPRLVGKRWVLVGMQQSAGVTSRWTARQV